MKTLPFFLGLFALAMSPLRADEKTPASTTSSVQDVTPAEAEKLIKENPKLVVLDVRTPDEFAKGHIPGAKNIDFFEDDFAKKVGALDPATPLIVHCGSGKRSTQALGAFKDKQTVYHLNEGFGAWVKAGKPVEEGTKK